MDAPIQLLTLPRLTAIARDAAEQRIPLIEANHYEGHIGAAFAGAFSAHSKSDQVEVSDSPTVFFCLKKGTPNGSQQLGA